MWNHYLQIGGGLFYLNFSAKDLIGDIQEKAREKQLSNLKQSKMFSSAEPIRKEELQY